MTPQERAAEAYAIAIRGRSTGRTAGDAVALSAALDEAEMVEAIRNAPCIIRDDGRPCIAIGQMFRHPECAARALRVWGLGAET